jgi:crossover junction endodeoxyribonuclease RusA
MSAILSLPYPPSVNHYWTRTRKGMRRSDKAVKYCNAVGAVAHGVHMGTERLCLTLAVSPPDRRRRDLDNVLKALLDAMATAGVYEDDSQIDLLIVRRDPPTKGGKVAVLLEVLPSENREEQEP